MCIRTFSEERVHGFHQKIKEQHDIKKKKKLRTFTSEEKIKWWGGGEVGEKVNEKGKLMKGENI